MRTRQGTLTQDRLKQLLNYDPSTGFFTWKVDRPGGVKAGDVAGCPHTHRDGRCKWQIVIDRVHHKAHRLAWLYVHGTLVPTIDHINGNAIDNRLSNLRPATSAQNMANSVHPKGRTGVRGVSFYKNRYMAQISYRGRSVYIGRFETLAEAKDAWNQAAIRLREEFARLD
jgi:hypothetical protein